MTNLIETFLRRKKSIRAQLRKNNRNNRLRLTVHRTNQHVYAQIIDDQKAHTVASASTLEPSFKEISPKGWNVEAAKVIGKLVAERALKNGVKEVVFDRSGYIYHGRVKALADAAREHGLNF